MRFLEDLIILKSSTLVNKLLFIFAGIKKINDCRLLYTKFRLVIPTKEESY